MSTHKNFDNALTLPRKFEVSGSYLVPRQGSPKSGQEIDDCREVLRKKLLKDQALKAAAQALHLPLWEEVMT